MARRHGVTSATISSGGVSGTLRASMASKSASVMVSHGRSHMALTSQHPAQLLFQAIEPALDRPDGHAQFGRDLRGGL